MTTSTLESTRIYVKPSRELVKYIKRIRKRDVPIGVKNIKSKKHLDNVDRPPVDHSILVKAEDNEYLKTLPKLYDIPVYQAKEFVVKKKDKLLSLEDLHWLYNHVNEQNENNEQKVYMHELFQGSLVVMPKNKEVNRSEELELRCKQLRARQENRDYNKMTKNVDCVRVHHPEDTIAFQMKQINTHLIAIAQFIMSVLAGFAFGFLGVELMIGKLDFGFRLLLGIICSLVIALAELYFLAKKLNEEMEYENPDKIPKAPGRLKVD